MMDYLRNCYQERNSRLQHLFVYHLQGKGLFLELRRIANGMIYAAKNDLQFVIESSHFAYTYRDGWADYFAPCCPLYSPEMEPEVARRFNRTGRVTEEQKRLTREIFWVKADKIRIGNLLVDDLDEMKKLFAMLLFKLNRETQSRVEAIIDSLGLPERHVAVQVRRGEKLINGEGKYHAGEQYIEPLQPLGDETGIFVMSDDYAAVEEVETYIRQNRLPNKVFTLVPKELRGIHFAQYVKDTKGMDPTEYMYQETLRLLAETTIVIRSDQFAGAGDTNVAHGLAYLHPNPSRCTLIH